MATTQEPEGLVDLGRQVAADATALVRAEIRLAKAHAFAAAAKFGIGIGLVVAGLIFALFFVIFTLGTLVEGFNALDSWPLYASVGSLLLGAALLGMGGAAPSWLSAPLTWLGAISLVGSFVTLIWFYVIAIIGDGFEIARRGWAITGATFFVLTFVLLGGGIWSLWKAVGGSKAAFNEFKEDAAWVKQLAKRNASES